MKIQISDNLIKHYLRNVYFINGHSYAGKLTMVKMLSERLVERKEILDFGMTFPDVYIDAAFHDDNWILLRYRKNKKAFAWTYERNGHIWVNVKVAPQWRDFWRNVYSSVLPAYHQNKEHWNSIILDGTIPDKEIKRMIAESYDLIVGKNKGVSP